jgi:hypothetical protein
MLNITEALKRIALIKFSPFTEADYELYCGAEVGALIGEDEDYIVVIGGDIVEFTSVEGFETQQFFLGER